VKNILKSVNIWHSYKQERGCLMHFARLAHTLLKDEERARSGGNFNIHLTANLPRNLSVKNFFNRLRFDRIMVASLWHRFLAQPTLYVGHTPGDAKNVLLRWLLASGCISALMLT